MADLLWECMVVSIVLLFGINIGLALGLAPFSRGKTLVVSILYGIVLFALSILSSYATPLYNSVNSYVAYIIGIIAIITVICGIYTIFNWKQDKKRIYHFKSITIITTSICCFTGFTLAAILFNNSNVEPSYALISILLAAIFVVIIFVFNLFSNFLKYAERPYPVVLGNYMILNGFYFLIAALFIPNIKSLSAMQMNPLSVGFSVNMIFMIMAGIGVLLVGVYLKTEGKTV